jgi:hypothetical protein
MNVEESVEQFRKIYPGLMKEEEALSNQITLVFEKKIEEIRPIIDLMKEKHIYFFHPDLGENIRSSHGVILGRNNRNNAEIYVADGRVHFLKKVDGYNNKVLDEHAIGYPGFFQMCDLEFAIKGIEYVRNYLPTLLDKIKNKNSQRKLFLDEHNIS